MIYSISTYDTQEVNDDSGGNFKFINIKHSYSPVFKGYTFFSYVNRLNLLKTQLRLGFSVCIYRYIVRSGGTT